MHLLILACSAKKTETADPLPAIDMYQGVLFSVLKKALREDPSLGSKLKILIVSAKYGLIQADTNIYYYDLKMTPKNAVLQKKSNTLRLKNILKAEMPETIVFAAGKTYLQSIDFTNISIPVEFINGEIGIMLHQLKVWLNTVCQEGNNAN